MTQLRQQQQQLLLLTQTSCIAAIKVQQTTGVTVTNRLSVSKHVPDVISRCAQSMRLSLFETTE